MISLFSRGKSQGFKRSSLWRKDKGVDGVTVQYCYLIKTEDQGSTIRAVSSATLQTGLNGTILKRRVIIRQG
jgi:hypothetical protein